MSPGTGSYFCRRACRQIGSEHRQSAGCSASRTLLASWSLSQVGTFPSFMVLFLSADGTGTGKH